jgi:hypothetical protein
MTFTIPNIVFVLSIAVTTAILTFLTTKGGLTDNRFSKPWLRLTKRGKKVFFLLVIMVVLLAIQEWNSQAKSDKKDNLLKKERTQRDSIITEGIQHGVDSSSKKLFNNLSEAFAKQELKFDPIKKEIKNLKDSIKNLVVNPEEVPVLMVKITHDKQGDTSIRINRAFIASTASAKISYMYDFWQVNYSDGSKELLPKNQLIYGPLIISKEYPLIKGTTIKNIHKEINYVNIAMFGSFSSLNNNKQIVFKEVYQYTLSTKSYQTLDVNARDRFYKDYQINTENTNK